MNLMMEIESLDHYLQKQMWTFYESNQHYFPQSRSLYVSDALMYYNERNASG